MRSLAFSASRHLTLITVGLSLLLLLGCTATPKVSQDSRQGETFNDLRSYSWRSLNIQVAGISDSQVGKVIDQQLGLRNYRYQETQADMLIDVQVFPRTRQGASTGIGIGIGLPVGRHGSIGLGTGQLLDGKNKVAAVIIVDITRASTNELVWRGTAEDLPLAYFELANEAKLRQSISDLLDQFPPR